MDGCHIDYPLKALENKIQGRVILTFVVEKDGSLTNIEVLSSPHALLAKEAVRVVSRSPKWTPGTRDGSALRVQYTIPLDFRMAGDPTPPPFSAPIQWLP